MSNNEIIENEEQNEEYIEQEENSGPSSASLFVDKIKSWLNKQNKTLVVIVSAVLIGGIGFSLYHFMYKVPRENEAIAAIYKVQGYYEVDSFKLVLKDAPKLAEKYSGTKGGNLCNYYSGMCYLRVGDYKKGLEYLENTSFDDVVMSSLSLCNIGDAYIENKDLDNGLKFYLKSVAKAEDEFSAVWTRKKAAKVYEKKNQWKEALELYEQIKANYAEVQDAYDVDKYIARAQANLGAY